MTQTLVLDRAVKRVQKTGFLVAFTPEKMQRRASDMRVKMFVRFFSLLVSLVLTIVFYLIWRPKYDELFFWILVLGLAYSMFSAVLSVATVVRAKNAAKALDVGSAFSIDGAGIRIAARNESGRLPWNQITEISGVNRFFTPGPRLEISWAGGKWSAPIIFLDVSPATLDGVFRAYSRGRFGLDLSRVDELW